MSDFLTQQQQRRRFTRVAVVESEESRGAFSFSNTREKFVLNRRVKFQGITNTQSSTLLLHAALFITIHTTIVMLLLYYY